VGGRAVALKILSRLHLGLRDADFRRAAMALVREGELLGGLHSACFVDVYRTGVLPDERPYLAMEYVEGQTLAAMITEGGALPMDVVVDIITGLGTGLAELHGTGLVHRDVTPANLIVTRNPTGALEIRMFDFGTVTKVSQRADRHRMGYDPEHPLGTAAYMSPEQAAAGIIDGRSDQFAVASIAFEMLTGDRPFSVAESGPRPLLEYLRGDGPIPARSLSGIRSMPDALAVAIHRGLDRDPAARFPTMVEFVEALVTVRRRAMASTGRHQRTLIRRLLGPK
jgi:serine/threonine-protein kinase